MSTFPKFSALPTELQLLIWNFALPDPRTIHITNIDTQVFGTTELYEPVGSRYQLSGILTACRTSREVFQNHYKTLCQTSSFKHDRPTYFDPKRDTLYLDVTWHIYYGPVVENFSFLASQNVLGLIRYIAVEYTPWSLLCSFHAAKVMVPFLELFPSVENLSFVFGAPCVCCQENLFKFPLDLLEVSRGSRYWPFKRRIRWKIFLAAERMRRRYPEMKLPKFEVKRIEKM